MVKIREDEFGVEFIKITQETAEREKLERWAAQFKLGTAGYRDNLNPSDISDCEKPFNRLKMLIVAEARAQVITEKLGEDVSLHIGGEVRPHTHDFIMMFARLYASHGITVHLRIGKKRTTPIWYSSFGIFYLELDGGENFTASHSPSFKGGWKPMDSDGKQLIEMAPEIESKVREIAKAGISIRLSPIATPLIRKDFCPRLAYTNYIKSIVGEQDLSLIRKAKAEKNFRVIASPLGGSMGYTSETMFDDMDIPTGRNGIVNYRNYKEDENFHGIGVVDGVNHGVDPGKWQIYKNLGAEELLHDDIAKLFIIWDPDGDRFNMVTTAPISIAAKAAEMGLEVEYQINKEEVERLSINFTAMRDIVGADRDSEWKNMLEKISEEGTCGIPFYWFEEMGYDKNLLSNDSVNVYFKPNQIYFMLLAFRLARNKAAGLSEEFDWVFMESYPTSRSLAQLAEKHGVTVFHTPVGFKHFGNAVKEIEKQLDKNKPVTLENILGETVELGKNPRIVLMCEESGGAVLGGKDFIKSINGKRESLALKEKDAMQVGVFTMVLGAELCLNDKSFAEYYIDTTEKENITYRHYERADVVLYDESIENDEEREKAKEKGIETRERVVGFFKSLADAKKSGKASVQNIEEVLNSYLSSELGELRDIYWAGDGTFLEFSDFWFELRASGTDAVLRYYIEGMEKEEVTRIKCALISIDGHKNACYKKCIS